MCKSKKEFEDVWEEDERLMFFCELDFKCLDASIFASREIFRKVYAMLWVEPSMQLFTSNMISTLHILRSWTHYTLQRKIHNSKEPKASFILKIAFGFKCIDWFDWRKNGIMQIRTMFFHVSTKDLIELRNCIENRISISWNQFSENGR